MDNLTPEQESTLNTLTSKGFRENSRDIYDDGWTVFLSKRASKSQTIYAEIDGHNTVNGLSLADYLKTI